MLSSEHPLGVCTSPFVSESGVGGGVGGVPPACSSDSLIEAPLASFAGLALPAKAAARTPGPSWCRAPPLAPTRLSVSEEEEEEEEDGRAAALPPSSLPPSSG